MRRRWGLGLLVLILVAGSSGYAASQNLPPLSADVSARIKAEEIYRDEIRKALPRPFWESLSSPFCIWLLSTVVVGGAAWIYRKWEHERIVQKELVARTRNIVEEVSGRILIADEHLLRLPKLAAWFDASLTLSVAKCAVYDEFDKVDAGALMLRLAVLTPDSKDRATIMAQRKDLVELVTLIQTTGRNISKDDVSAEELEAIQNLMKRIQPAGKYPIGAKRNARNS